MNSEKQGVAMKSFMVVNAIVAIVILFTVAAFTLFL